MSIYRGPGGAGDAVADSSSEALLVRELAIEVQADADAAEAAKNAALAAQAAAELAETNAETAETNAETAETNAAASASSASSSASTATTQAGIATTQATNASNSATAAASSASSASTSATNAAASASAASTSATAAASSASSASTSATNAANSATSAASSATTATTQATNASNSATAAATSATNAANSATSASTSATTATTQAGIATTQATNAANSATASATSATNTANSASAASTSASNAATSATNAANSATAAAASAASAAASFDAFNDIYLGAKSSNPTVDNDGDALTVGDQYFNTVSNELRVWNGSSWQAASTVGGTVSSLTVNGATALNGGATLGDASGDALTINSSAVSIPNGLNFDSNTLVIDATNNRVGVGTSSPNRKLQVAGDVAVGVAGTSGTYAVTYNPDTSGNTIFWTKSDNYFAWGTGSNPYSPTAELMRITATGNVGIGTSSPENQLQVGGDGILRLRPSADNTQSSLYLNATTTGGNSYRADIQIPSTGGIAFETTGTINTAPTERMRIDSSGNLGIGTSSPNAALFVAKQSASGTSSVVGVGIGSSSSTASIELFGSTSSGAGIIDFAPADGATDFKGRINYDLTNNYFRFYTNATERMRLDSSGNLGLGVTPSAWNTAATAFQLGSTVSMYRGTGGQTNFSNNSFLGASGNVYSTTAAASLYEQTVGTHRWYNAPSGTAGNAITFTQAMTLDASGNLGLGTTSPDTRFHVVNSSTNVFSRVTTADGFSAGYQMQSGGGVFQIASIPSTNGQGIAFTQVGFGERMRIDSSGYLRLAGGGIQFNGDTSAANALDDYEEGTFTPVIQGASTAGTGTYTVQVGRYTKIGNIVTYSGRVTWTAHTGAGLQRLLLPFTVANISQYYPTGGVNYQNFTVGSGLQLAITANFNTNYATFDGCNPVAAARTNLNLDTAADIMFTFTYQVA
jgi:hypothetical protein